MANPEDTNPLDQQQVERDRTDLGVTTGQSSGSGSIGTKGQGHSERGGLGASGDDHLSGGGDDALSQAGADVLGRENDDTLAPPGGSPAQTNDIRSEPDAASGTADGGLGEGRRFSSEQGGGVGVGQSDEERLRDKVQDKLGAADRTAGSGI